MLTSGTETYYRIFTIPTEMTSQRVKTEYQLSAETELRCEAHESEVLALKLVEGTAEIFGIEMAQNREYQFIDENFAVFTWYGCKIEVYMALNSRNQVYQADSTPNIAYVNTHSQLEARRDIALANNVDGPKIMIVGDMDHGKSSTAKMLVAYAARLDRTPIFIDLDVGKGALSIPGTIAAVQVDKASINIEETYPNAMPLTYFFGYTSPKENLQLYKLYVDMLAEVVRMRLDNDLDSKSSGLVINTCGWVEGSEAINLLNHIVSAFKVDVVLVMNNDKLYASLLSLSNSGITVVKLPTSGGIVRRDQSTRRRLRKNKIKEYFYGRSFTAQSSLSPARLELKLSNVKFVRAGGYQLSEGMKSLTDESSTQSPTELVIIHPTADLLHSCLGVLSPLDDNRRDAGVEELPAGLIKASIAGFVVVVALNVEQNSMTVLSPCPGTLPSKYLIVGNIKWQEK